MFSPRFGKLLSLTLKQLRAAATLCAIQRGNNNAAFLSALNWEKI
jgi:hypothetical protein